MKLTFWPCHRACRILVPQPGDEPAPLAKCRVQTTGPPGNSSEWMKSVSVCGAIRAEAKNRVWDSCGGGVKRRPQSHALGQGADRPLHCSVPPAQAPHPGSVYTSYAHRPRCLRVTLLGKGQRSLLARVLPPAGVDGAGGGDGAVTPVGFRGGGNRGVETSKQGTSPRCHRQAWNHVYSHFTCVYLGL